MLALTWKMVAAAAVAAFVGYELEHQFGHSHSDLGKAFGAAVGQMAKGSLGLALNQAVDTEKKKKQNTNPFDGVVSEDIVIGDTNGNNILAPEGYQLGGSKDGTCIQQKDKDGRQTGLRKDGKGHPPSPVHQDSRSHNPHAHVPGITNPDGTPWLPIN